MKTTLLRSKGTLQNLTKVKKEKKNIVAMVHFNWKWLFLRCIAQYICFLFTIHISHNSFFSFFFSHVCRPFPYNSCSCHHIFFGLHAVVVWKQITNIIAIYISHSFKTFTYFSFHVFVENIQIYSDFICILQRQPFRQRKKNSGRKHLQL